MANRTAQRWPTVLPGGSVGKGRDPLAGGGLGESDRVAGGKHDVGVVLTVPPPTAQPGKSVEVKAGRRSGAGKGGVLRPSGSRARGSTDVRGTRLASNCLR